MTDTSRRKFVGISASGAIAALTGCSEDQLCEATPEDIEGPYYREGIPIRDQLAIYGDPGVRLSLRGVVVDGDCTPVGSAVLEFWHASPVVPGAEAGQPDASYDTSEERRYYGQTATDAAGRYQLETLVPGWYLNGSTYRPAHVHVKIWIGEQQRLTTQLYFAGDPFNDGDPWYNPELELALDEQGNAVFDFAI